jgi:hypothetical protein
MSFDGVSIQGGATPIRPNLIFASVVVAVLNTYLQCEHKVWNKIHNSVI